MHLKLFRVSIFSGEFHVHMLFVNGRTVLNKHLKIQGGVILARYLLNKRGNIYESNIIGEKNNEESESLS